MLKLIVNSELAAYQSKAFVQQLRSTYKQLLLSILDKFTAERRPKRRKKKSSSTRTLGKRDRKNLSIRKIFTRSNQSKKKQEKPTMEKENRSATMRNLQTYINGLANEAGAKLEFSLIGKDVSLSPSSNSNEEEMRSSPTTQQVPRLSSFKRSRSRDDILSIQTPTAPVDISQPQTARVKGSVKRSASAQSLSYRQPLEDLKPLTSRSPSPSSSRSQATQRKMERKLEALHHAIGRIKAAIERTKTITKGSQYYLIANTIELSSNLKVYMDKEDMDEEELFSHDDFERELIKEDKESEKVNESVIEWKKEYGLYLGKVLSRLNRFHKHLESMVILEDSDLNRLQDISSIVRRSKLLRPKTGWSLRKPSNMFEDYCIDYEKFNRAWYREFFAGKEHYNYIVMEENPIIASLIKFYPIEGAQVTPPS